MSQQEPTPENVIQAMQTVSEVARLTTHKFRTNQANLLIAALECGMPPKKACQLVGISPAQLAQWVKKGEEGIAPYDQFLQSLTQTALSLEKWCLSNIKMAADQSQTEVVTTETTSPTGEVTTTTKISPKKADWKAAAYMLERLDPEQYGKKQVENQITNNTQIIVQLPDNGRNVSKDSVDVSPIPARKRKK